MGDIDKDRYIREMGIHQISRFFTDMLMDKFSSGQVPVYVDDNGRIEIYFVEADRLGRPKSCYLSIMKFKGFEPRMYKQSDPIIDWETIAAVEHQIEIEYPLVSYCDTYFDFLSNTTHFMWKGRTLSEREIPKEKLNVTELMKLAQTIIQGREGLIVDEAIKNRLIK